MEPALELAQVPGTAQDQPGQAKATVSSRICLMSLGGELFAVDLRQVREVFEPESVTPVPGMPAMLVGVANLRGTVMPLADLRPSLGVSSHGDQKLAVVVRHGQQQVGILIDEVPEIRTIHSDDLVSAASRGLAETRPFVSGLAKIEERMSSVMDVSKLLACVEGVAE